MQTSQISTASVAAARSSAAWIDRGSVTVIKLTGADRIDLLHRLTTNDLRDLRPGFGKHTVLLTDKARIIDVIAILHDADASYLLCSPGQSATIVTWLRKYIIMDDVSIQDMTDSLQVIEICGPRSSEVVDSLFGVNVGSFALDQWFSIEQEGANTIITRQPSACEVSYWVIAPRETTQIVRENLFANQELLPRLTDVEAEYVRITAGMGKHGHEWTDAFNPLEAGLLHMTSFAKGCYIGQEVVARLDSYNKVKQRIMGLLSQQPLSPQDVITADGTTVGVVTSVVQSCDGSTWFALGYVRGEHAHPGTPITVVHDSASVTAELALPPMTDASCQ